MTDLQKYNLAISGFKDFNLISTELNHFIRNKLSIVIGKLEDLGDDIDEGELSPDEVAKVIKSTIKTCEAALVDFKYNLDFFSLENEETLENLFTILNKFFMHLFLVKEVSVNLSDKAKGKKIKAGVDQRALLFYTFVLISDLDYSGAVDVTVPENSNSIRFDFLNEISLDLDAPCYQRIQDLLINQKVGLEIIDNSAIVLVL